METQQVKRGRGRPKTDNPATEAVTVRLTPDQVRMIDQRRGTTPRATWLARLIRAALGG